MEKQDKAILYILKSLYYLYEELDKPEGGHLQIAKNALGEAGNLYGVLKKGTGRRQTFAQ